MAYLAFTEFAGGALHAADASPVVDAQRRNDTGFSPLEWSVIAIAHRDRLSTLREPGRISVVMGAVFGGKRNPRLADPRLEALRRIAVLTWHYGYVVPSSAVRAFLAADYSLDQYETLVSSVSVGRAAARQSRLRR